MASLHLQDIPEVVLKNLQEAAAQSGRSIDEQAIESLQLGIEVYNRDRTWVDERLAAAKALREKTPNAWITDIDIRTARDEGRA